jgi:hypothetical protein
MCTSAGARSCFRYCIPLQDPKYTCTVGCTAGVSDVQWYGRPCGDGACLVDHTPVTEFTPEKGLALEHAERNEAEMREQAKAEQEKEVQRKLALQREEKVNNSGTNALNPALLLSCYEPHNLCGVFFLYGQPFDCIAAAV